MVNRVLDRGGDANLGKSGRSARQVPEKNSNTNWNASGSGCGPFGAADRNAERINVARRFVAGGQLFSKGLLAGRSGTSKMGFRWRGCS